MFPRTFALASKCGNETFAAHAHESRCLLTWFFSSFPCFVVFSPQPLRLCVENEQRKILQQCVHVLTFFQFLPLKSKVFSLGSFKRNLMKFTSISMALVCAMLMKSAAATTQYVAPALTDSLSASSQAYLIGISSTFLFLVCAFMAVSALTGIDYSNDSLLVVDVEPTVDEQ